MESQHTQEVQRSFQAALFALFSLSDGRQIIFSSSRLGYRDEAGPYDRPPQPYAELFIVHYGPGRVA